MTSTAGESLWADVGSDGHRLHLRRFAAAAGAPAVLMIHGSIANGRVFWSTSGRGLAPFLAGRGLDCWVLDLRGRGRSTPAIGRGSSFGQTEAIVEDLAAAAAAVEAHRGAPPELWLAHSWGGVLALSHLVRFPERSRQLRGLVCLAVKRRVTVRNLHRRLFIDILWRRLAPWMAGVMGYLPARGLRLGADNETRASLRHSNAWVRADGPWIDPGDGFDYQGAARTTRLPPVWHLVGVADRFLGHPRDVELFRDECGGEERAGPITVLSRAAGFRRDYGHADILTSPEAPRDHFPAIAQWLLQRATSV